MNSIRSTAKGGMAMMKKRLATLALSIVLAVGLMPAVALAADGSDIGTGKAQLASQGSLWGWVSVEGGDTFYGTPQTVTVNGLTKSYTGTRSYNMARFIMHKDGSVLCQEDVQVAKDDWLNRVPVTWSCVLSEVGNYRVEFFQIYDWGDGWGYQRKDDVYEASFAILKDKAASTIKLAKQTKTYTGKALSYTGKVAKTGSAGKVTFKYYSDAKCTKAVAASKVRDPGVYYVRGTVAADAGHRAATSKAAKLTVRPKGTSLRSVKAASGGFAAKWAKQAKQTTGYQVRYSADPKFKKGMRTITVGKRTAVSKKVTGLKAKTKYYVQVRTYKTVNGKKLYSTWSKAKAVKTPAKTAVASAKV